MSLMDMTFFITREYDICRVVGWWHPKNHIVADYLYLVHEKGTYPIFGKRYVKLETGNSTLKNFENAKRLKLKKAHFIEGRYLISMDDVIFMCDPFKTMKMFVNRHENISKIINKILSMLGVDDIHHVGMVGEYQLGLRKKMDSIDLILRFDLSKNLEIHRKIKFLAHHENMGVIKRGKLKPLYLRYKGKIFRFHFAYRTSEDAFKGFSENYEVLGRFKGIVEVTDITHSIYMPVVLKVRDLRTGEPLNLVIYDENRKGEYQENDMLFVYGDFISTEEIEFVKIDRTVKINI